MAKRPRPAIARRRNGGLISLLISILHFSKTCRWTRRSSCMAQSARTPSDGEAPVHYIQQLPCHLTSPKVGQNPFNFNTRE